MTGTVGDAGVDTARGSGLRAPKRVGARVAFFAVLLVVLVGYTEMAFELRWTTTAGRIGPGFFPRIIGILAAVVCLGALVNSLRGRGATDQDVVGGEEELGEGDLGRHSLLLLAVAVAAGGMVMVFLVLGAVITGAAFMFVVLSLLNRGAWWLNAVLSVAVPLGLFLLFQTALNAGLPPGVLPAF